MSFAPGPRSIDEFLRHHNGGRSVVNEGIRHFGQGRIRREDRDGESWTTARRGGMGKKACLGHGFAKPA